MKESNILADNVANNSPVRVNLQSTEVKFMKESNFLTEHRFLYSARKHILTDHMSLQIFICCCLVSTIQTRILKSPSCTYSMCVFKSSFVVPSQPQFRQGYLII